MNAMKQILKNALVCKHFDDGKLATIFFKFENRRWVGWCRNVQMFYKRTTRNMSCLQTDVSSALFSEQFSKPTLS